jgi:hypothetical protein
VPAGTASPGTVKPAGILVPTGNVKPAGIVVPAGTNVLTGTGVPVGTVTPPNVIGALVVNATLVVNAAGVVNEFRKVIGAVAVVGPTIGAVTPPAGAVKAIGVVNDEVVLKALFSTALPPPKKISGRREKLSDKPTLPWIPKLVLLPNCTPRPTSFFFSSAWAKEAINRLVPRIPANKKTRVIEEVKILLKKIDFIFLDVVVKFIDLMPSSYTKNQCQR